MSFSWHESHLTRFVKTRFTKLAVATILLIRITETGSLKNSYSGAFSGSSY